MPPALRLKKAGIRPSSSPLRAGRVNTPRRAATRHESLLGRSPLAGVGCARRPEWTRPPPSNGATPANVAPSLLSLAAASPGITGSPVPGPTAGSVWELVELGGALFAAPNPGAGGGPGGVFRSDDGGLTWGRMSNGLPWTTRPGPARYHESITALAAVDGTLLAGTHNLEIYRSTDAGVTWLPAVQQPEKPNVASATGWLIRPFAVLPKSVLALTTFGTFVSSDRGNGWVKKDLGLYDHTLFAFDGVLYATTDEGVRVSYDQGKTFELKKLPHAPDGLVARNGVVYVSFQEPTLPVWASGDRGRTWRATKPTAGPWSYLPLALYGISLSAGADAGDFTNQLRQSLAAVDLGKRGIVIGTPAGRGATTRLAEAGFTARGAGRWACGIASARAVTRGQRNRDRQPTPPHACSPSEPSMLLHSVSRAGAGFANGRVFHLGGDAPDPNHVGVGAGHWFDFVTDDAVTSHVDGAEQLTHVTAFAICPVHLEVSLRRLQIDGKSKCLSRPHRFGQRDVEDVVHLAGYPAH